MRHKKDHRKLGRTSEHRKAMLQNMVNSLIEHETIKTTVPKAKEARRIADRVVTYAKKGIAAKTDAEKVHYQRLCFKRLNNKASVKKLFDDIAPRYTERNGGYTRVLKAGFRLGDKGTIAVFQFV